MTKNDKDVSQGAENESDFMSVLEEGVRKVLKTKGATPGERTAAITAGARLLMIKFKISGDSEKGFFD